MFRRFLEEELGKAADKKKPPLGKETTGKILSDVRTVPVQTFSPSVSSAVTSPPVSTAPVSPSQAAASVESLPSGQRPDQRRQFLKLERYDGKTEVEGFLKRFEVCARRNGWDDNERLDHLMCSLAAPVDQILWDFESASILTWPDLV